MKSWFPSRIPVINGRAYFLIALVGLCASFIMYRTAAHGPGVSPDSTVYIEAARSLITGNGFFVNGQPMTHYPPGFPILLAAFSIFTGGDILVAARLLGAVLFGTNVVLLALAVSVCTRQSPAATSCVVLLFLLSTPVFLVHSMAWSEAPFIVFSLSALILLSLHIRRPSPGHLASASLLVGIAAATRYIGVTLFPSTILSLFLLSKQSVGNKMRDAILFFAIAGMPLASWLTRNMLIAQTSTNRTVSFHPIDPCHVTSLIDTMYNFVLPIPVSVWTKYLHTGIVIMLFVLAAKFLFQRPGFRQRTVSIGLVFPLVLLIHAVIYIVFLFFSISFIDAHTPVDHRILLPVFLALMIVGTSFARVASEVRSQKGIWYAYLFFVLFAGSINFVPAISQALAIHQNGLGYTARYWKESATLRYLSHFPDTTTIYSNCPDLIRFLSRKPASLIPVKVLTGSRKPNKNYQRQMDKIVREWESGSAVIAYLDNIAWRWYLPSKKEIDLQLGASPAFVLKDGVIYETHVEKGETGSVGNAKL